MIDHEQLSLPFSRPVDNDKKVNDKQHSIGVAQLVDALRLVERQLPIVLSSDINERERTYITYLVDRALRIGTGGQYVS
ncbi:MAG: hypothetical protein A4E53_04640 [Pelotomaculum sp. PtaB.Bin104]|nr:MAG: hypothetical protein A4E53_04640 [Pelotomaculum sp. PtaB.Bin104]